MLPTLTGVLAPRRRAISSWVVALGACGLVSCATPGRGVAPAVAPSDCPEGRLALPPSPATEGTWRSLTVADSCRDRWKALRYLLDLRDSIWAFEGLGPADHDSRSALAQGSRDTLSSLLGRSVPLATDVDAALQARLEAFPDECPGFAGQARSARALLVADATPRELPAKALEVVVSYKRVLQGHEQLAPNARLRLVRWCSAAFHRAVRAEPSTQQSLVNQCLFPLFEADPRPYFREDPSTRPPDPPWPLLRRRLRDETARLLPTRFAHYAKAQLDFNDRLFARASAQLPSAFGPGAFELPQSSSGQPLDRLPVVAITPSGYVVDNQAVGLDDAEALYSAIARRRAGDGAAAIVVVCQPHTELRDLFAVGRAAHRAAVRTLYLGVRRKVADNPPAGDVQASLAQDGAVWRTEGIPLSLRLLGSKQRSALPRDLPKALGYDARQTPVGLALSLRPGRYQLSSVDGVLPTTDLAGLRPALLAVHQAYPQPMSLVVAAAQRLRYAELVSVAVRSRFHGVKPLFPGLALTRLHRIRPRGRDIKALVWALSHSRVSPASNPDPTLAPLLAGAHRCYRIALRRAFERHRPWPEGIASVRPGKRPALAGSTVGDRQLSQCIQSMIERHPPSRTAQLALHFTVRP